MTELHAKGSAQQKAEIVDGLTAYTIAPYAENVVQPILLADGSVCAQVTKLNMSLRLTNFTVYVAKDIPSDSCAYQAIREHEFKHVNVVKAFTTKALPFTKTYIQDFLQHVGVIRANSAKEATDRLNELVKNYILQLDTNLVTAVHDMQKQVDTPEEYKRIGALCNGEVSKFVFRDADGLLPFYVPQRN